MNFVLDASLFEGSTPAYLLMLVFMASLGRHRIEVPEEAFAGFRSWAQSLGDLESDILEAENSPRGTAPCIPQGSALG